MKLTEFELKVEVQKFYKGYITTQKALKLYEIEHGIVPEIVEPEEEQYVNSNVFEKYDLPDYTKEMQFMKELQDSGVINMIVEARTYVQQTLLVDNTIAKEICNCYLNHYQELYFPEEML